MIACNKQITATMGDFDEHELKEVDGNDSDGVGTSAAAKRTKL